MHKTPLPIDWITTIVLLPIVVFGSEEFNSLYITAANIIVVILVGLMVMSSAIIGYVALYDASYRSFVNTTKIDNHNAIYKSIVSLGLMVCIISMLIDIGWNISAILLALSTFTNVIVLRIRSLR